MIMLIIAVSNDIHNMMYVCTANNDIHNAVYSFVCSILFITSCVLEGVSPRREGEPAGLAGSVGGPTKPVCA